MDHIRALIEKAIGIAGSQAKLAEQCGVKQASIWQAKDAGRISAELAIGIHNATDGVVSCRDLRPDLPWDAVSPAQASG